MAEIIAKVKVTITNLKAVRALGIAARELEEVADAMSWQPGLKRAAKALRYAVRHLTIKQVRDDPG